jgi:outer membrane lipoprotein-sorting protein
MIKRLMLLCLLLPGLYAHGQYPGYLLVNHPEIFKKDFARATTSTESIQADFTQEKSLTMLSEKINSTGKFWFLKKDKLRMEYLQPYTYVMILNAGKILIKDDQKANTLSASSNKVFQQVNRILIDCVSGTMLENPDFQNRVFENTGFFLVELTPVSKNLKGLYKNINIVIDKKDYSATEIGMIELSGDVTLIRFKNKELNARIPESVFNIP